MRRSIFSCLVAACCWAGAAMAGSNDGAYVVGPGDVLQLNVWQAPNLDRSLTVRADGMVVLPLAGEIRAAGLTTPQLEDQIARRLGDYNRNVHEVTLTLAESKTRSVYVLGHVVAPGKYSYADAVSLFDVIREAGGFTEDALKTRVKVVHRDNGQEKVEYAETALDDGSIDKLPKVKAGDTVMVAKRNGSVEGGSDGVQVLGAVRTPAIYELEDVKDLVGVLLLAGGPLDTANLKGVKLVRSDATGNKVAHEFNLSNYFNHGMVKENPSCQSGDTVYVPNKRGPLSSSVRTVSIALGSVATSIGLYYAIQAHNHR
jgi:polysaccharide export outer membrane protein